MDMGYFKKFFDSKNSVNIGFSLTILKENTEQSTKKPPCMADAPIINKIIVAMFANVGAIPMRARAKIMTPSDNVK